MRTAESKWTSMHSFTLRKPTKPSALLDLRESFELQTSYNRFVLASVHPPLHIAHATTAHTHTVAFASSLPMHGDFSSSLSVNSLLVETVFTRCDFGALFDFIWYRDKWPHYQSYLRSATESCRVAIAIATHFTFHSVLPCQNAKAVALGESFVSKNPSHHCPPSSPADGNMQTSK